jgi:cation:H+ antiporter
MSTLLWVGVLVLAVLLAHWGAEKLTGPIKKLTKQFGLSPVGGGALVGLAAASPEIAINVVSAFKGVSNIGLGTALGSNIIAIPLMVMTAYVATRKKSIPEAGGHHKKHVQTHIIRVDRRAVSIQAIPYILIVIAYGVMTLPSGQRGLQARDGWILLLLYIIFLIQAILRGRTEEEKVNWNKREVIMTTIGVIALAGGAFLTVKSTENLVKYFKISEIIGGLFITAPMAALPEVFATWSITRSGQISSGITSVISDHAVTMSVAMFPLALVGVQVSNFNLFANNLFFVLLVPVLYALFIHFGQRNDEHGFLRSQVIALGSVLPLYVVYMVYFVI